jgi:hypothetical protein
MSILIAIHTWYVAGTVVAIAGFQRFIHVALLAPIVATIITNENQIKSLIYVWMASVVLGGFTIFYQVLGYDLSWFLGKYIAMRGGLYRYKSLLGEPNVGGLAAVISYTLNFLFIRAPFLRIALATISVLMIVFSLSKAAWILFAFANLMLLFICIWKRLKLNDVRKIRELYSQAVAVLFLLFFIYITPAGKKHLEVGLGAVVGTDEESPSAYGDLYNRIQPDLSIGNTVFTNNGAAYRLIDYLNLIFGRSFSSAGSAAVDLGVPKAYLPHNMYLEIFSVGGLVFLFVSIGLIASTAYIIGRKLLLSNDNLGVLIIPLLTVSIYMLGYPNMYEPVTGSIYWIIIGAACFIASESKVRAMLSPKGQS